MEDAQAVAPGDRNGGNGEENGNGWFLLPIPYYRQIDIYIHL